MQTAAADAARTAPAKSGWLRARSKIRYAPATARPTSTAPCRFDQSTTSGTSSQIRRVGARASARSSAISTGKSSTEKSCDRTTSSTGNEPIAARSRAKLPSSSPAPLRRRSHARIANADATATICAASNPRPPAAPIVPARAARTAPSAATSSRGPTRADAAETRARSAGAREVNSATISVASAADPLRRRKWSCRGGLRPAAADVPEAGEQERRNDDEHDVGHA